MKTRKLFMRAMAVALAVIMVVAAAVPAFAEGLVPGDPLSITIYENKNSMGPSLEGRTFYAFQILKGNAVKDDSKTVESNQWDAANWNNYSLSDIEWGDNILLYGGSSQRTAKFLRALINLQANSKVVNEQSKFNGWLMKDAWPEFFDGDNNNNNIFSQAFSSSYPDSFVPAEDFAKFLEEHQTTTFLQELCAFLVTGPNRQFNKIPSVSDAEQGFLGDGYLNVMTNGEVAPHGKCEEGDNQVVITVTSPGYYMIVEGEEGFDESGEGVFAQTGQMYSEYMLAVLGNQALYEKAVLPKLDKTITGHSEDLDGPDSPKGDTVAVGDTVTFTLTGTLPEAQWETFIRFDYVFWDDLSNSGLDPMSVKIIDVQVQTEQNAVYTLKRAYSASELGTIGSYIWYSGELSTSDFHVAMQDLKQPVIVSSVTGTQMPVNNKYEITGSDKLIVHYSATVDGSISVSLNAPSKNRAWAEYSNDPNSETHGYTEDTQVNLYSFALNLTKADESDFDQALPDAEFVLYDDTRSKIAKFTKITPEREGAPTEYEFAGWDNVSDNDIAKKIDALRAAKAKYDSDESLKTEYDNARKALENYLITSDSNGNFLIKGIDDGKYQLEEVIAPKGYNTLSDPIEIEINPTLDEKTGLMQNVEYKFNGVIAAKGEEGTSFVNSTGIVTTYVNDSEATKNPSSPFHYPGYFNQTLLNEKAPFLPFTGGVGTIVFYAAGGVLIVGALIYLVIASKKRKNRTDA